MVSIRDKLAFFKTIIQDRVEAETAEQIADIKERYAHQTEVFEAELELLKERRKNQAAYEADRAQKEELAQRRLALQQCRRTYEEKHFHSLMQACERAIQEDWTKAPKAYLDWVVSDLRKEMGELPEIVEIEGQAELAEKAAEVFPKARWTAVPIHGIVLYTEDRNLRFDYSLETLLRAKEGRLMALYQDAMKAAFESIEEVRA